MLILSPLNARSPRRSGSLLAGLLLGAVGVTPQHVVAQGQSGTEAPKLEEIVVTATKYRTDLMDTPVSITALTEDSLIRNNATEIRDISGLVPNVQFGLSPGDSGVQASIRGVTSTNFTEIGDPAVGIHIDGLYSPRPQGALALMFDLEQVEVLRGPQGTLFGRNATGGVVNVVPARPDFKDSHGDVQLQVGNYNERQIRGFWNFGGSDLFSVRATFIANEHDGYIKQHQDFTDRNIPDKGYIADGIPDVDQRFNEKVGPEDSYANADEWAGRLSLRLQPTDTLDWTLSYEHYQNDGAGDILLKDCERAAGTRYACTGKQFEATINVPGKIDMTLQTARSVLTWDATERTTVEYRIAYAIQKRFQQHDDDSGYHPLADQVTTTLPIPAWGDWSPFRHIDDRATWTLDSRYASTVQELQLKQQFDQLRYVAGAFWMHERNEIDFAQDMLVRAPFNFPIGQYYHQPDRQVDARALFAQADWQFVPAWTLTLGARYSRDEKNDKNGQTYDNDWDASTPWYYNGLFDPGVPGEPGFATHNGNELTRGMGAFGGTGAYPGPRINSHQDEWSKFTWRLGISHDIGTDHLLFASAATGYKAGGFSDRTDICGGYQCIGQPPGPVYTYLDYEPETLTNYEVGYKGMLFDRKLRLSTTFFFSDYKDLQVTGSHAVAQVDPRRVCADWEPACDIISRWKTENVAKARMYGLELEYEWLPWTNGRIEGFVSWLHTEVKEYPTFSDQLYCGYREEFDLPACPPPYLGPEPEKRGRNIYDVTGNQLPYSPEYSLAVSYEHRIPLANGMAIVPWVSLRWQDKMYFTVRNLDSPHLSDAQQAYTLMNASLKLVGADGKWELEAFGNNITNEYVMNWFGGGEGFGMASYNPPRTYGARLRYRFD